MTGPPDPAPSSRILAAGPEEQADHRRRRRRAGWQLLVVLLAATTIQVVGQDLAGTPTLEAVLVIGPFLATTTAAGVLLPRPPGGFTRLRRRTTTRQARPPDGLGFDLVDVACMLLWFLPGQLIGFWLQGSGRSYLSITPALITVLAAGIALMYGILELRRRRQHRP